MSDLLFVFMYSVPEKAWYYEGSVAGGGLTVIVPDTPPTDASHARVVGSDGSLKWRELTHFIDLVEETGDIRSDARSPTVTGDLALTLNRWRFAGRTFVVNSFHLGDHDCWCYELYQSGPPQEGNNYLEVRIPDAQPEGGPFVPGPAENVLFLAHGRWTLPWPVFRHFIAAIRASGDIVPR